MKLKGLIEDLTNYLDDNDPEYNPEVRVDFILRSTSCEIDCVEYKGLDDHNRPEYIAIFIDGTEGVEEIMDDNARKEIESLEEHIDQLEKEKDEVGQELKQARKELHELQENDDGN
jgi:hypothetical protein